MTPNLFYIITQPGFEDELEIELAEFWGLLVREDGQRNSESLIIHEKSKGGLLIECEKVLGLQINFFSKLASRVLWRVATKKIDKLSVISDLIRTHQLHEKLNSKKFRFKIEAAESFHWNESRYKDYLVKQNLLSEDMNDPCLYIRVYQNKLTLSVDTSGVHLHQRGYRQFHNQAPIRETVAGFCLRKLLCLEGLGSLRSATLVDGMCGSGTFLFEAQFLLVPLFLREFSFLKFNMTPKILKSKSFERNFSKLQPAFKTVKGYDVDESCVQICNQNLKQLSIKLNTDVNEIHFKFETKDFFNLKDVHADFYISNPPYGHRKERLFDAQNYLTHLLDLDFKKRGVIWPQWDQVAFESILLKKKISFDSWKFKNGGLDVLFYTF